MNGYQSEKIQLITFESEFDQYEHTNGLIRRFLPKGTDFNEVSDKEIAKIEHTLNTRRRASLNYRSPNHVFLEYLMAA
ncbi:Transposase, IS30 family (plasmid) [Piscirickettsia salmonis]|nr:hypothetical protein [Piscirickettsia salmonis]QGP52127.1 Transposase, IS30 family [Piscirickettsia salmonis]